MEQVATLKRAWNVAAVLHIVQKVPENYCPCLYLSIGQVLWFNELWFKRCIQKCTLFHVLILIMTSQIWKTMGWLNIQILKYLENRTSLRNKNILNLCFRWHILRSYRFVAEVSFKRKVCRWQQTLLEEYKTFPIWQSFRRRPDSFNWK